MSQFILEGLKAIRLAEIYSSKFTKRVGRATPKKIKMSQSEFFYSNYPYKKTKILEFDEIKNLPPPDIEITEKPFITNRMKRKEKFLRAPKKLKINKNKNISEEIIENLFIEKMNKNIIEEEIDTQISFDIPFDECVSKINITKKNISSRLNYENNIKADRTSYERKENNIPLSLYEDLFKQIKDLYKEDFWGR